MLTSYKEYTCYRDKKKNLLKEFKHLRERQRKVREKKVFPMPKAAQTWLDPIKT